MSIVRLRLGTNKFGQLGMRHLDNSADHQPIRNWCIQL